MTYAERHSVPEPNTGCWLWLHSVNRWGYGRTRVSFSKERQAHRIALEEKLGELPQGMLVLHSCDTPACINPAHLRLGTARDNARDMVVRGRCPNNRGSRSSMAKLTEETVAMLRSSPMAYGAISEWSRRLGVSRKAIRLALDGKTWV